MKTKNIRWLHLAPEDVDPIEALRIVAIVLKGTDAEHIAMALKHRKRWPDLPAGHCGLRQWVRRVIKSNKVKG